MYRKYLIMKSDLEITELVMFTSRQWHHPGMLFYINGHDISLSIYPKFTTTLRLLISNSVTHIHIQ